MHWNGLLISLAGLLPTCYGTYCLRSPAEREECRNASNIGPRIIASIPGNYGFVLEVLFGVWMIVDGIIYVFVGHSLPPFNHPS